MRLGEKEDIESTLRHLEDWSTNFQTSKEIAPLVDKAIEQKKWELGALGSIPDAAQEIPHAHLSGMYSDELTSWNSVLPPMPSYSQTYVLSSLAVTTSASSATFEFISRAAELPEASGWANREKSKYVQLQTNQDRPGEVRGLLLRLGADRAAEFEQAENAYRMWHLSAGINETSNAAILMRNVLEHVKGDLLEKAISRPTEQKIGWSQMAERIAVGGSNSTACQVLTHLEIDWKSLHLRLTQIAKNMQSGVATDLEAVFSQWIDHIYALLGLIDPKYL